MKRIVSVSIGSSRRNHVATTEVLGEQVQVERIGTDGSLEKAIALIKELDGKVDAFGMGGLDLYVYAGNRRYSLRDGRRIAAAAVKTPMADGSGLKNTLERRVVHYVNEHVLPLAGKKTLMTMSVDRFGMAEALWDCGVDMVFGDLMFGLGLKIPIRSVSAMRTVARILLPVVAQLPISWLYPTGEKQNKREPKFGEYFQWADVIAGDWLYIGRHSPDRLDGKVMITNTVTPADVEGLRERGAHMLVTTTPNLGGRSFGTNVMEGLIIAAAGKRQEEMTPDDYNAWLDKIGFTPRVEILSPAGTPVPAAN